MPLWPFRRKSRRKRGRASTIDEEYGGQTAGSVLPPRSQTMPEVAIARDTPTPNRQASKRQRTEPNKLHRRRRSYSFSPGRDDSERVGRKNSTRAHRQADAPFNSEPGDHPTGVKLDSGVGAADDGMLWRVPTLRNKRDGDHLPRKVSSKKRRKNDQQREAEIKAMSNFVPHRPATEDWMRGRPLKKESRKVRTGFGSGIRGADNESFNRSSDVSLPLPESIDSALSSDSDYIAFKVSALEALAPRPTLRYIAQPRPGAGLLDSTGLMRRPSQRGKKLAAPIPEATLKAHKRVDSIADELSASGLRELMERDQRRRARKRQLEQERLEQKLARRAEKQKAAEAEAQRHGRESPPNLERGVLGREDVGLGIDPSSAVVTSSRIRHSGDTTKQRNDPLESGDEVLRGDASRDPLVAFHRVDSIPMQTPDAPAESKEHDPLPAAGPVSKGSFRRKLSRSKSPQQSEAKTEQSELPSKESDTGTPKGTRSWASFFRWGNKNKRNSGGPASFSNTSRDSMQTMQAPTPPPSLMPPRRVSSGVPKRTMSRFREDLPELPISPPASRIQSPEAEAIRSPTELSPGSPLAAGRRPPSVSTFRARHDTPLSEQVSVEAMRQTPSTFSHPDEPGVSPEPQATSLASIDSEGSWFSGRLSKKRNPSGMLEQTPSPRHPRHMPESDMERQREHDNNNDDMYITEDDYLARLAPPHGDRSAGNRKSTGEARPSSDWEEAQWGSVRGQQPTVVRPRTAARIKSREGLLRSFGEDGESILEPADAADSSDVGEDVGVQRATSVDYGKAARRVSAGSARLLSITPRSSIG
ncbi:hypothetical protein C8A03DRAFT_38298 [Achaetomium macrosporum]|uniref:Uncharacterized protein n=1 Tax=Achaetomium macrosporum TaxID=79813 RepID=A0AAN7H7B4_9PEZI|nr:hypothetical protein C8A03DRAFT_38298 [Achaetomium macrosporum]